MIGTTAPGLALGPSRALLDTLQDGVLVLSDLAHVTETMIGTLDAGRADDDVALLALHCRPRGRRPA